MKRITLALVMIDVFVYGCNAPSIENVYRKENRYPGGIDVPVAFLVSEWGGKARVLASGWLIEGGNGTLLSAKHFTDVFMNNIVELGANECKIFLNSKVYSCVVVHVPPQRDAVVLKMFGHFNSADLPVPYKISKTKLKTGDKVFIQGFHPHPLEIIKSNEADGFKDLIVSIMKTFYELRMADPTKQKEVVFDNLEGRTMKPDPDAVKNSPLFSDYEKKALLEYENDSYIKVRMNRDHKFSLGGLSGGVALNEKEEAVGIITAQDILRFEYDKDGFLTDPHGGNQEAVTRREKQLFDTIYVTPIESVQDLYDYARKMR